MSVESEKKPDDFRTPAQLVLMYPVSLSTIYSACQEGLLAFYRLSAKRGKRGKYLIRLADFLAWLEANRHEVGEVEEDGPLQHIK